LITVSKMVRKDEIREENEYPPFKMKESIQIAIRKLKILFCLL